MASSTGTSGTGPAVVLVLNAGSSSLKASLHRSDGELLWGDQRRWSPLATDGSALPDTQEEALDRLLDDWLPTALAPWEGQLRLVGHRVVHGGEIFSAPTRLTPAVLETLSSLVPLAPLHNPPALWAMHWLQRRYPKLEGWACFDTAFHATLPLEARTYAIPASWRAAGLRRFGFHGLNHQHVSEVVSARFDGVGRGTDAGAPLRLVSCHLGAGCSLCAVRGGRSIATTMGFTPMEGLVMATRSGSVDPGLLLHQLRLGVAVAELDDDLNRASGLLGLSGLSGDMREVRAAAARDHAGAQLALAVFRHQLLQGIGAMAASLGGVDVIALSGGIGEHDDALLGELESALAWLGPFTLLTVPADEEGQIVRQIQHAAALQLSGRSGTRAS